MNLGDRIRQARKVAGMTQTQLADASGMSQQMISKLESGGSPATSNIVAIAMALNVSAEWLDSGEKKLEPTEPGPEFVPIERVKLKVSAGVTGFTVEHLDGNGPPVYYRADWLKEEGLRAERLFALRVSGDSMQPSLWDGDLIVVNTEDKVKDGSYQKIQPGLLTLYYSGCILLPNTPPSRRAGGEDGTKSGSIRRT